jgi:hypothetical protein
MTEIDSIKNAEFESNELEAERHLKVNVLIGLN